MHPTGLIPPGIPAFAPDMTDHRPAGKSRHLGSRFGTHSPATLMVSDFFPID